VNLFLKHWNFDYAKEFEYTIASMEYIALSHADAAVWYITLLFLSKALSSSSFYHIYLVMHSRYSSIDALHPGHAIVLNVA
jgi:hypothetical protein